MSTKEQILIIDDHKAIRILLSNFLENTFDVVAVADAYEALAWMKEGNVE